MGFTAIRFTKDSSNDAILEKENKKGVAGSKWWEMANLTSCIKINNHKLGEQTKPI